MHDAGDWVLGFCTVVLAVGGLFVSAGAGGDVGYYGGLAMFAFGVLFAMRLVRNATGRT